MYLSQIKLWNFRKFGSTSEFNIQNPDLNLNLTKGVNVLIGENDSGKTAIIDAVKLVLKTHSFEWIKFEDIDFYENSSRFRIELCFKELSPEEAKNFTEWLDWEEVEEKKIPILRVNLDVKRTKDKIQPADIRAGADDEGYRLTPEAKEFLKTTYLKPLRNAESELIAKRNSRLSQILIGDEAFKGREYDHELVEMFQKLNENLVDYFKGEYEHEVDGVTETRKPVEGQELKKKIDNYIKAFYSPQHESAIDVARGSMKSILEKLSLSLKDEPNPGLGTLNRLFMAAELLHLQKNDWSGLRLGLIEELEAHLHPQAQMQVVEHLQELDDIQLLLTTHSPNLASKLKLKNLIICNSTYAFPMGANYTLLDGNDYKHLERFLDTTKANLFFAKGVILVEGWSEELLIPAIAHKMGYSITKSGVSVVNLAGTSFLRYCKIYKRSDPNDPHFNIPVSVITDVDVRPDDEETQIAKEIKSKRKKFKGGSVEAYTSPLWTLEYCLYYSPSLSEYFQEIAKDIHSGTNWDDFETTLIKKLKDNSLKKVEIADKLAQVLFDNEDIEIDRRDPYLTYIINAIKYAAGQD